MNKINRTIIITAILSLGIGMTASYYFFGDNNEVEQGNHDHEHTFNESAEQVWTCSMHPQIRQYEPGDCPICGMDLITLDDNTSTDPLILQMTEEAIRLADIQTTLVEPEDGSLEKILRLPGKVSQDERRIATQVSHVPGRVEKLYVSFTGEAVYKGQKLADVYSPELVNAQRELLESLELVNINPGLVEAARNKLRYWKIGEELISELESNNQIMETFPLYAEHSGIVKTRKISVGDYVKQGSAIFELLDLTKVWVIFDAYEENLKSIKTGDNITFTTPSIPDMEFTARVSFIDPMIDPNSRTVSIRTELINRNMKLKPEMLVYGSLKHISGANGSLKVPKSAVLWTGKRSVVYVKLPDVEVPSFAFREIELGENLGDSYSVLSGLKIGEEVVTYGNFAIDAAAQLNNQTSMMNRMIDGNELSDKTELPDFSSSTPEAFRKQLYELATAYLDLKDALVATDPVMAKNDAAKFQQGIDGVDMKLLKGKSHIYWMDKLAALQAHSEKISSLGDVEEQRKQFDFLSEAMIETVRVFGIAGDTLYVQHCPMAIGKGGADWISDNTQIRNPYFGDAMLKCGSVTDTISMSR